MARDKSSEKDEKLDLFKKYKDEYIARKKPVLVETTPAQYLSIEGRGAPGSDEFQSRIGALYGAAYTIKMTRKFDGKGDYKVCALEGIYWIDGKQADFGSTQKEEWNWKLMIRTPDSVTSSDLNAAVAKLIERGKGENADQVKLERLAEGKCVQMLHVGPYDQVGETIEQMHEFLKEQGLNLHGHHHEIYLSDPRRVPPERLKTIVRHPVS